MRQPKQDTNWLALARWILQPQGGSMFLSGKMICRYCQVETVWHPSHLCHLCLRDNPRPFQLVPKKLLPTQQGEAATSKKEEQ